MIKTALLRDLLFASYTNTNKICADDKLTIIFEQDCRHPFNLEGAAVAVKNGNTEKTAFIQKDGNDYFVDIPQDTIKEGMLFLRIDTDGKCWILDPLKIEESPSLRMVESYFLKMETRLKKLEEFVADYKQKNKNPFSAGDSEKGE